MSAKRKGDKSSVLSKQEIATRRKQLTQKKLQGPGAGRRAIAGVAVLTFSVLSFLSVLSFDVHDRVGPGFHNAIGPVGHATAELLRGAFGICAFALPLLGVYLAVVLFTGERDERRWPQAVSFSLLLVAVSVLAQLFVADPSKWAHAPGGLVGREVGGLLTALFSTVGTVVLMSAIATVAAIVGTRYAFLDFCSWAWERALVLGAWLKDWGLRQVEAWKARAAERVVEAEKARLEEADFLSQLEEQHAELDEAELVANEAEAAADEQARLNRTAEEKRAAELTERELMKLERERLAVEREATRLAREALKTARVKEKENRAESVAAIAPLLLDQAAEPAQALGPAAMGPSAMGDPAWAQAFGLPPPPPPEALVPSLPPPPRRQPTIHEPPVAPPPTGQLHASVPPVVESAPMAGAAAAAQVAGPTMAELAVSPPAGATALATHADFSMARTPVIVEPKAPPKPTKKKEQEQFHFAGDRKAFTVPAIDALEMNRAERTALDKGAFLATAEKLTAKLRDFGIEGEVVEIRPGPVVTMYEFKPAPGVKISKIASLSDDLAMAMEAMRVRIVAPIPGKGVVGIEVPNKEREIVFLKEIAEQDAFQKSASKLTMCLGKDIEGMPYVFDLAKAPHLLMAGTTGSGKSVAVNAMIMSILLKSTPEEVRFIMVDPKMLELSVYEGIPHLLLPVVTDPRKAALALQWAVDEMTRRYRLLADAGVRNITGYNALVDQEQKRKAAPQTIDVKPTSIKPKEEARKAEAPAADAAAVPAEAQATPPGGPKKKRRLLIVDVAEAKPEGTQEPAPAAAAAPEAAGPEQTMGVAAPRDLLEDPREGVTPEVVAEVVQAAKEAEIRVDEPTEAQATEEEAAMLAEAAAEAAAGAEEKEERKKLPYIVVIIDELADLMMVASKEVETSIARLAQMARAAGIHLMVATQRPSTDVVTGVIKANFPTRITFMLRSKPDSMTIIGTIGAEALLGMGDMLIMPPTSAHLQRVHGCFVSEVEIKRVVDHLKAQGTPVFDESILKARDEGEGEGGEEDDLSDELYDQALAIVSEMRNVSISMLQRKMRIGYNRSARMIERMEREGVVGAADGAKPREVLIRPVGEMSGPEAPL